MSPRTLASLSASASASSAAARRARSYLARLPLFTRAVLAAVALFWAAGLQSWWNVRAWGALVPREIGFATLYRINTFPLIHLNTLHALMNAVALTPLLERFEHEHGTLTSVALFFGPLTTFPALLYVGLQRWVMQSNVAVMGASMWVFLLLGMEAIRTYKVNPYLVIATYNIPTWTTPIALLLCVTALVPSSSFLGHLAGLVMGYIWALGYLKVMAPPEKLLRWIEGKLDLVGRLPHYVSVDQKTYGRFGVLPTTASPATQVPLGLIGSTQRLGP